MLKRFLVPEKDQVMVSEDDARAATEASFLKMGLPEHYQVLGLFRTFPLHISGHVLN